MHSISMFSYAASQAGIDEKLRGTARQIVSPNAGLAAGKAADKVADASCLEPAYFWAGAGAVISLP